MLKRILAVLLSLTFLVVLPALSGCEEPEGDRISVKKTTKVENLPVGERVKQTGD